MTTILIWLGSGFAFSVGVFCGVISVSWGVKNQKAAVGPSEKLLEERNEIGRTQAAYLLRIAECMELEARR